jgi:hypothetical protein
VRRRPLQMVRSGVGSIALSCLRSGWTRGGTGVRELNG